MEVVIQYSSEKQIHQDQSFQYVPLLHHIYDIIFEMIYHLIQQVVQPNILDYCVYQVMTTCLARLSPEKMETALQEKTFTDGEIDRPLVLSSRNDQFCAQLGSVNLPMCSGMRWDNKHIKKACQNCW